MKIIEVTHESRLIETIYDVDNEVVECLIRVVIDDDGSHMPQLRSEDTQDFIDLIYEVRIMRSFGTCCF